MKNAIRELICVRPSAAGAATADIMFPETFVGFRGHFAGRPVLPGVCLVLAVLVLAESTEGKPLSLCEIVSAKFFSPVVPDSPVQIDCRLEDGIVRAKVTGKAGRVADVRLKVTRA